ncbi:MAG TPA: polysaccharide deacetylase family protein [Thermodesulfovibrionales bacterium]|nr:polysaccharide deacetylase family protein [Thermodesulfovibrionales bacterium]
MKLIITIDTEEDNWASYNPTGDTLENIKQIPLLQQLFNDFKVTPTYLVTYSVAADKEAVSILRNILEGGQCEIGTHCHPWNTPPFEEENNPKNRMLCNLPVDLQYRKIKFLHDTIQRNFDIRPISFRSGRWGYNKVVAENIYKLGYKIDTSIISCMDWTSFHGPDFSNVSPSPFRFSYDNIFKETTNGHLIEVPATVGFLQSSFTTSNYIFNLLRQKPFKPFKLIGLLYRLHMVNKVWLSPEVSNASNMIKLVQRLRENNLHFINMFFHSSSLKAGLTPFVKTKDGEKRFFQCLREFFAYTRDAGIESIKLKDVAELI